MPRDVNLEELEMDLREKRQLPYTLIVEKIEGDVIYTHNQWGNNVKYRKKGDNYEIIED